MSVSIACVRSLRQKALSPSSIRSIVRYGSGYHGPTMPAFAQLRPPTKQLPEEVELIWDDSVAPETCIDFDASHISTKEVLGTFFAAFAAIFGLYTIISIADPAGNCPVAPRSAVIPPNTLEMFYGMDIPESGDAEEEAEEEEEE